MMVVMASCAIAAAQPVCGQRWSSDGVIPGVDGLILDMARMTDGDVVVAGDLTIAGRVRVGNIARFDTQTQTWDAMGIGTDGRVRSIALLPDGRLLVGGQFEHVDAQPAPGIAIYSNSGWSAIATAPIDNTVNVDVGPDGSVWLSGFNERTGEQGTWRGNLTTWTRVSDSVFVTWRYGSSGNVFAVDSNPASTAPSLVVRWDGSNWLPMGQIRRNPQSFESFAVTSLNTTSSGELIITGEDLFQAVRGANDARVTSARWTGSEWVALTTSSSRIAIGQSAPWTNGVLITTPSGAFLYNNGALSALQVPWRASFSPLVTLVEDGGSVVAAGLGPTGSSSSARGIVRVDGLTTRPFSAGSPFDQPPQRLVRTTNNNVVAFGFFSRVGDQPAQRVAVWNGSAWTGVPAGMQNFTEVFLSASGLVIGRNQTPNYSAGVWDGQELFDGPIGNFRVLGEAQTQSGEWLFAGSLEGSANQFGLFVWDGAKMSGRYPQISSASSVAASSGDDLFVIGTLAGDFDTRLLRIRNGVVSDITSSFAAATGSFAGGGLQQKNGQVILRRVTGGQNGDLENVTLEFYRWTGQTWLTAFAPILGAIVTDVELRDDGTPIVVLASGALAQFELDDPPAPGEARVAVWDASSAAWRRLPDSEQTLIGQVRDLVPLANGGIMATGEFSRVGRDAAWGVALWTNGPRCCDSSDINADGLVDGADVRDLLNVLSGGPCVTPAPCDTDFNNDGIFPDDRDIVDFLTVLAGGACS